CAVNPTIDKDGISRKRNCLLPRSAAARVAGSCRPPAPPLRRWGDCRMKGKPAPGGAIVENRTSGSEGGLMLASLLSAGDARSGRVFDLVGFCAFGTAGTAVRPASGH